MAASSRFASGASAGFTVGIVVAGRVGFVGAVVRVGVGSAGGFGVGCLRAGRGALRLAGVFFFAIGLERAGFARVFVTADGGIHAQSSARLRW